MLAVPVALRKESVDRNANPGSTTLTFPGSLSARRAWIEILTLLTCLTFPPVALRKESVDRNKVSPLCKTVPRGSLSARRAWIEISTVIVILRKRNTSLSARRAWIEISIGPLIFSVQPVALRKESVDRNMPKIGTLRSTHSRSPQGERG